MDIKFDGVVSKFSGTPILMTEDGNILFQFHDKDKANIFVKDFTATFNKPEWYPVTKRPPRPGEYVVYGLEQFVPDHVDERNAVWTIKIGYYGWPSKLYKGWNCKVKYWMPLPAYPTGTENDYRRDNRIGEDEE